MQSSRKDADISPLLFSECARDNCKTFRQRRDPLGWQHEFSQRDFTTMALRLRERIFWDRTNPFDMYGDHDNMFLMRYRFGRRSVADLSDELSFANARLSSTSPIIQLLLTLKILACGGFLIDTGNTFGLTKATVGWLFDRVVNVLAGRLHQSARRVQCEY